MLNVLLAKMANTSDEYILIFDPCILQEPPHVLVTQSGGHARSELNQWLSMVFRGIEIKL